MIPPEGGKSEFFSKPGALDAEIATAHKAQVVEIAEKTGAETETVERVAEETAERAVAVLDPDAGEPVDTELADEETVAEVHAAYDTEFDDLEMELAQTTDIEEDSVAIKKEPTPKEIIAENSKRFARSDALRRAEYVEKYTEEYGYDHLKGKGLSPKEISDAMKQEDIEDKTAKAMFRLKAEQMMYKKLRERTDALTDGMDIDRLADADFRKEVTNLISGYRGSRLDADNSAVASFFDDIHSLYVKKSWADKNVRRFFTGAIVFIILLRLSGMLFKNLPEVTLANFVRSRILKLLKIYRISTAVLLTFLTKKSII